MNRPSAASPPPTRVIGVVLLIGCLAYFWYSIHDSPQDRPPGTGQSRSATKTIAVLPFLDLTDGRVDEETADTMTRELIERLGKVHGLRVAASATSLGVNYVLDGGVRRSGATLRVAARLSSADDGHIIWSQTYDRPVDEEPRVQDDIAGQVAEALQASIT